MNLIPILAATAEAHTSIMDTLPHLAGMLMVVLTLATLWGVCAITAKLVQIFAPGATAATAPVAKPATAKPATAPTPAAHTGIPPEIIAVIAAAVATATGDSHRIISIKPMSTSWEKAGRQSVLTSHRLR